MSKTKEFLIGAAGALLTLIAVAATAYLASNAGFVWPPVEALTLDKGSITSLAMAGLVAGQLGLVIALFRMSSALKNRPAPPALAQGNPVVVQDNEPAELAVLPRTPQNIALELAVMSDSTQRFLVWMRAHGMSGEVSWTRLRSLYEEFCEMVGEEADDMRVLGKRLIQCGCQKPPMRNTFDGGKRTRQQFYIIPERYEPEIQVSDNAPETKEQDDPTAMRLAA